MASDITPAIIHAIQRHIREGRPVEAIFSPAKERGSVKYILVYDDRNKEWSTQLASKIDFSVVDVAIEALSLLPPIPREVLCSDSEVPHGVDAFKEVLKNLNILRSSADIPRAASKATSAGKAEAEAVINFSSRSKFPEKTLSNFYPTLLYLPKLSEQLESQGIAPYICELFTHVFPSVENAYQLLKAACLGILDSPENFEFASSNKIWNFLPQDLKRWVNKREDSVDPEKKANWEKSKATAMSRLIKAKLRSNPVIADYLRSTSGVPLRENTSNEYWGTGPSGSGANHLGRIYENLRAADEEGKDNS